MWPSYGIESRVSQFLHFALKAHISLLMEKIMCSFCFYGSMGYKSKVFNFIFLRP